MSFCSYKRRLVRIVVLSLVLISVSTSIRGDERTSKKPEDWKKQLEMLRSMPYVSLTESMANESEAGVLFYDPEKACEGYNLYCTSSSGEALLLDIDGQVVHRWTYIPQKEISGSEHAVMLENGDLVVIKMFQELFRLDWDSKLIWKKELAVHHDVAPAPDGSFYVAVREYITHRGMRVRVDAIVHLTPDGEEIDRWNTYDHLAEIKSVLDTRSFLDSILDSALCVWSPEDRKPDVVKKTKTHSGKEIGRFHVHLQSDPSQEDRRSAEVKKELALRRGGLDYFHTNTIGVLPATGLGERDSRFQMGNLLVCFRNVNQIAVLEKGTYRVLWAWGEGQLQWPHHPTMLEDGHILIFDNGVEREYSRVVELDPVAGAIVWEYMAEPPEDFFSFGRGSAQRLPNGNTLICESDKGHVFEVTQQGEVVWTWLNPSIRDGRRETLYRLTRLPKAQVDKLQQRWRWWE